MQSSTECTHIDNHFDDPIPFKFIYIITVLIIKALQCWHYTYQHVASFVATLLLAIVDQHTPYFITIVD